MAGDIKVGQKFLSGSEVGEILTTTRKHPTFPVIWLGETSGEVGHFTSEGKWFYDRDSERDLRPIPEPEIVILEGVDFKITSNAIQERCQELQESGRRFTRNGELKIWCFGGGDKDNYRMLPLTITEGVEFSGEAYRAEFERLLKIEGREFEVRGSDNVLIPLGFIDYVPHCKYVLLPQHRDADGNPLKAGDRVQMLNSSDTITGFNGRFAQFADGTSWPAEKCRKLTTRTRPLCADDLMKHRTALFRMAKTWSAFSVDGFDNEAANFRSHRATYHDLQNNWEWSPSADQPWGPCEVTEEVPV